jgi:hypothetical protein
MTYLIGRWPPGRRIRMRSCPRSRELQHQRDASSYNQSYRNSQCSWPNHRLVHYSSVSSVEKAYWKEADELHEIWNYAHRNLAVSLDDCDRSR